MDRLGLTPASTLDEVEGALLRRLPGLPAGVFESDLTAGLRAHFEATATPAEPAMAYRSWDDCMMQNGVLPASLFLIGVVFGFGLLAELASGGAVTPPNAMDNPGDGHPPYRSLRRAACRPRSVP